MVAVAITRTELTAADLRGAATQARDGRAVRRILALALVLDGQSRGAPAAACGMDRQTLRSERLSWWSSADLAHHGPTAWLRRAATACRFGGWR